jgi:hypothetical protein
MSAYNPPRENVPIFDASLFDTVDSGGGLTQAEADLLYLKWPFGQVNETLAGNTTMTGNLILDGVAATNYLEFPDGTQQFTAATGTGELISSQLISASTLTYNVPVNITPPANCRLMVVVLASGGGQVGTSAFSGDTIYAGQSGGGGSVASTTVNLNPANQGGIASTYAYYSTAPVPATRGNGMTFAYSTAAQSLYGITGNVAGSMGNPQILQVTGGSAGQNATVGQIGTAQGGGGYITFDANPSPGTQYGLYGSTGKVSPTNGFSYSGSNITINGGRNVIADTFASNAVATTLASWVQGQGATYNAGATNLTAQGTGGIALFFFS